MDFQSRRPARKALWLGLPVLLGVSIAVHLMAKGKEPAPREVQTVVAERMRLQQFVRATGHLEPSNKVRVSASVTGDLVRLAVKEGQRVERGALLAEIEPVGGEAMLRQRYAHLRAMQAQAQAEEARVAQAKVQLESAEQLHVKQLTSEVELGTARRDAQMAQAQLETARQKVRQAEEEVAEVQARLGRSRILAPVGGTVIDLEKKQGERLRGSEFAEDVLLTLAPLDSMEVEVEVGEQDVVLLEVGQPATVKVKALGELEVAARVADIATSATILNRGQPNEVTRFKVRCMLESIPERLRPGMTALVSITARTREDALAVPFEAVTSRFPHEIAPAGSPEAAAAEPGARKKAVPLVFVVEAGRGAARPVETGLIGDTHVEILQGLKEGEEVVVGPYLVLSKELAPGMSFRGQGMRARAPAKAQGLVAGGEGGQ